MIGQKTIHSFFSPVAKKRDCKDSNEAEDAKNPVSAFSCNKLIEPHAFFPYAETQT